MSSHARPGGKTGSQIVPRPTGKALGKTMRGDRKEANAKCQEAVTTCREGGEKKKTTADQKKGAQIVVPFEWRCRSIAPLVDKRLWGHGFAKGGRGRPAKGGGIYHGGGAALPDGRPRIGSRKIWSRKGWLPPRNRNDFKYYVKRRNYTNRT